jgi:hypothetical protein
MKKLIIYTALGTALVTLGIFFGKDVFAYDLDDTSRPFISRLSEKLGLKEEDIANVIDDVEEELQAERQAERAEVIIKALDEGKLTEREAEILDAMEDVRMQIGRPKDLDDWQKYSPEQREALREARRELRKQEMQDGLYDLGIDVSQEEMDALHEKMLDLEIGMYGRRGERGLGMGHGMMLNSQN